MNLSENRQKEIINVCFEEFALKGYDSASLSNIISRLGLAKGSFYRYFENKLELYLYLNHYTNILVSANFVRYLNASGKDFFKDWTNFFLSLSEIEKEYPMAIRFRMMAAFEQSDEVSQLRSMEKRQERTKFMRDVLSLYQEKGLIRKDIDLDFLSLFLVYFNFAMSEYIHFKYEIPQNAPIYAIDNETLQKHAESLVDIIKKGTENANKVI